MFRIQKRLHTSRKSQVLLLIEINSEDTKYIPGNYSNIWFQTGQLPLDQRILTLQKLLRIPIQVYFMIIQRNETKSGLFIISFRRKNYNPMELVYKIFQKKPNQTIG
jgi:hypothetical protein